MHSLLPHLLPLLLLLLLLLLILLRGSSQQPTSLDPTEVAALRDIRSRLRDLPGSNFFTTWDFTSNDTDPCTSFSGIICSQDDDDEDDDQKEFRRVSVLTLGMGLADSPGLTGILSPSIANLTALTEIVIHPGRIGGAIPSLIGTQCRRLRLVSISNNLISGQIPDSLIGLTDLHTLDLGHNQLTGSIPSLPNLKVLILASNRLSGPLPASLTSYTQLLHLDIGHNSFTGPLPLLPPNLRFLSATANALSGPLDAALSADPLYQLSYLDLSANAFAERIPSAVFALPKLSTILLQRNNFTGPITLPVQQQQQSSWAVVDLSHNAITGDMPVGLSAAASLYLNNNRLTGPVPDEYAKRVYAGDIATLYAQHNFLTAFPSALSSRPLPLSVSLCLSYNCMAAPESAEVGCPDHNTGSTTTTTTTQQSRPAEQCGATRTGEGPGRPAGVPPYGSTKNLNLNRRF